MTTRRRAPAELVRRLRSAGCVFAEEEAGLLGSAAGTAAEVDPLVERRVSGEPLEHVLGWVEFCGLRLTVEPGVFVPRRRTALLVEQAAELAQGGSGVVVELCCGCGAVGAALAERVPELELHAVDAEPVAVRCARGNLAGQHAKTYVGDLFDPLPARLRGRVHVVVANAPYVPTDEIAKMPPEARLYEPRAALDGGADGLDTLRAVVTEAPQWLAPTGHLAVESSRHQAAHLAGLCLDSGLQPRIVTSDALGATVVTASVRRDDG